MRTEIKILVSCRDDAHQLILPGRKVRCYGHSLLI